MALAEDLFNYYVKRMVDAVHATGRQALVWEGAALGRLKPNDAIVMVWEGDYMTARQAMKLGLPVINCPGSSYNISSEYARAIDDWSGPKEGEVEGAVMRRGEKGWELAGYKASGEAERSELAERRRRGGGGRGSRGVGSALVPNGAGGRREWWTR